MPLDIPATAAEPTGRVPEWIEPQFPADGDDWQGILRRIFETESGIWQRRGVAGQPIAARG